MDLAYKRSHLGLAEDEILDDEAEELGSSLDGEQCF